MFRRLCIGLFFACSFSVFAQNQDFNDQTWNFGDVAFWRNDTAVFKVRNGTQRNLIFLPTYYNENFTIMFNNRAAEPGETIEVSIVYYTQKKGRFDVEIPLYINQKADPIHFRLKGNIKGFDPAAQLRCPSVNEGPSPQHLQKIVTLEVRDRQTEEQLIPDQITVRTHDNRKVDLERSGFEYEMSVEPGKFKITTNKKGYDEYMALISLEAYQNHFIIYLDKAQPDPEPPQPPQPVIAVKENTDSLREVERRRNRDINPEEDTATLVISGGDKPENHEHPDTMGAVVTPKPVITVLNPNEYRLNNVILIVDVSSSMNREGKMDMLKSSFGVLVDALRAEDKVGVVTMSSDAKLIQPPVGVIEKDSLKSRVNGMKATGGTNAGAALQLAYQLAADNYIPGGNNQIIIATDGVFYGGSMSRSQMEKAIANANAKNIHLSTVGIGNDPKAMQFLQSLAVTGGGSFVQILQNDENQAALLEMIKAQSRKNAEN